MTLREKVQRRIAEYDDAMLVQLAQQMDRLEQQAGRGLTHGFTDMVQAIKERNKNEDAGELMNLIDEAVQDARRR